MNPIAILKLIAAMMPIISDQELAASVAAELRYLFVAIHRIDAALARIETQLETRDERRDLAA